MKYLKYFKTDADYQNYFNSDDFVTPNVSYVEDADVVYYNPNDLIIMTSESNPEVMKVCYNQGWAASPYETHASEAAKVTSIGTAFQDLGENSSSGYSGSNISFTFSFDEFKYFTGVDSIDNRAFYKSNIVSIIIPDSVTSIGADAFFDCSSLTSITIPDSVTSISDTAFDSCDSLPVENNLCYADTYLVRTVDKSLSTYTIKEGTKWIGNSAFRYCSSLTSITIPDSVTSIGESAFENCSKLKEITCFATTAPSITTSTFTGVGSYGNLYYPSGSDYSSWLQNVGFFRWTGREIQH